MKAITGKKLYALALAGALAAVIIAGFVASINPAWYHVPMFVVAFCFAALYYKADMPHMWSYLLLHVAVFTGYIAVSSWGTLGELAAGDVVVALAMLAFMGSTGVVPVCIAYWVYKLTKRRMGR